MPRTPLSLSLARSLALSLFLPRFAFCYYGTEEKRIPCERTGGPPLSNYPAD